MLKNSGVKKSVYENVATELAGISDPRLQAIVAKNATKELIGSRILAALPKSATPELSDMVVSKMNDAVDNLFQGDGPGHVGQYANDMSGADLSLAVTKLTDEEVAVTRHGHLVQPGRPLHRALGP